MKAHQREIREENNRLDPREVAHDLSGYSIETISRHDAAQVIIRYEWLGTMGRTVHHIGLVSPQRELHGVACFGHGPAGYIRKLIGEPALCLERGACVHYAPRNAASFLINNACKLIYRIAGVSLFFAYADPKAGEYGGVYQAAGWAYLGQGLQGRPQGRKLRYEVLRPGLDPNDDRNWCTTRELRRGEKLEHLTFAQARAKGWHIRRRAGKHVYAIHVGRERKRWRKALVWLPYPAPYPELKRKLPVLSIEPFRITPPIADQADMFASLTKF
jgi:hypothetical protein